jgi:hypothetical protein
MGDLILVLAFLAVMTALVVQWRKDRSYQVQACC